jgi:hypothetical protein
MTASFVDQLLTKYLRKGILVDTNLLLLYFMGEFDPAQIGQFKRTNQFTVQDFYLIRKLISLANRIVTTPNILTEVSNLASQLPESSNLRFLERLNQRLDVLAEEYCPSVAGCAHPYFSRCGLTDAVIMHLARNQYLVVTEDFRLAGLMSQSGIDVINFNHIRQSYMLKR